MSRDWEAEMKKIDKQLESVSDESLLPAKTAATPVERASAQAKQATTSTLGVLVRLFLAAALGVGMLFWPYPVRCGVGLFGYLAATGLVAGAGIWTAVWTWRHRSSRGHVLSLLIMLWGALLGAREILPRIGYATPTEAHPAIWLCR